MQRAVVLAIATTLMACGAGVARSECTRRLECAALGGEDLEQCIASQEALFAEMRCEGENGLELDRAYEQLVACKVRLSCTDYPRYEVFCSVERARWEEAPRCGVCSGCAHCAAPDTLIATPGGERRIDDLRPGDLVFSVERQAFVVVPLEAVRRVPVKNHRVLEVELSTGRSFQMSPGHPQLEGTPLARLRPGDALGGVRVLSVREVAFTHPYTVDILPRSQTGAYVAAGALVGSTLARDRF